MYNPVNFPIVFTNKIQLPHCNFCGSIWGVTPTLDYRFSHTDKEARQAGWLFCCGYCWAHIMHASYSNRKSMKPKDYKGYYPVKGK